MEHVRYGDDRSQFGELTRAAGPAKGVVVVIHGGFWRAAYDLSLGRPLVASLVEHGWTAYNLEYRRVGNGGGYPQTLDDVAAGIDALATVEGLDTATVITLGHSAGGHLAVWAAGRPKLTGTPWADPAVPVTAAISQAGCSRLPHSGPPRERRSAGVHGRPRRHHVRGPERPDPPRRTGALCPRRRRRHRADQPVDRVRRPHRRGRRRRRAGGGRGRSLRRDRPLVSRLGPDLAGPGRSALDTQKECPDRWSRHSLCAVLSA